MVLAAACGTTSPSAGNSATVNPSTLYQDKATSGASAGHVASNGPGSGTSTVLQPVVSDDPALPPGESGELVPSVGDVLGELTPQQKLVLNTAYYLRVKKCMAEQGFTLLDPPPKLETSNNGPIMYDGYIGIIDQDYAEKYGYQLNPGAAFGDRDQGQQRVTGDPKYEKALKVSGDDGCDGDADRMIENNIPSEDQSTPLLGKIYQSSLDATYATPAYKKALGLWSTCMKAAGFDYATPLAAFTTYHGFEVPTPTLQRSSLGPMTPELPSAEEVNTAVTDVACKRSSRLADVFRKVFWNHQLVMAAKNRPTLKVLGDVTAQKLRNAQQMIKDLG